jgi:neurotrimin
LEVIKPSDITEISGDTSVVEGGIVKLTCKAEGFPPPKIYWTRDEKGERISLWDEMTGRRKQGL